MRPPEERRAMAAWTALDDATARDEDDEDDEDDDIDDNIEGAIDVLVCSRVFRVRQTHTSETRKFSVLIFFTFTGGSSYIRALWQCVSLSLL